MTSQHQRSHLTLAAGRIGFSVAALLCATAMIVAETPAPRPAWTTSRVAGAPQPPPQYRLAPAFAKLRFDHPTSLTELPAGDRLLATEIGGKIFTFAKNPDVTEADLAIDLVELLPKEAKQSGVALWSATLHPKFVENRQVFVCYRSFAGGEHNRIARFTLSDARPPRIDPASEKLIIKYPSGPHSAGCILFGVDGMLYISVGDGAGPNPPDNLTTGQDISDVLGSILRIDVDSPAADAAYGVPADNPFVSTQGARPEVWAYGLRNPWKFGIDRETGVIFAADNGWETWEMVHRIVRGGNCGWPVMEGRAALRSEVKVGPTPIRPPVKDHPHTEANSVVGGPIYRGKNVPALSGWFVYGDYITGTIWALREQAEDTYAHQTLLDTDLRIVAFAEGTKGELYVVDYDSTGQIYELLPANQRDNSAAFPRRLSETGLFASLKTLEPAAGVVPYEVKVPRWMDGATARRWIAIPGQEMVSFPTADGKPTVFPEGTVLVKHIEMPTAHRDAPQRLETQLLHREAGSWRTYSYLWDEDGLDAALVDAVGGERIFHDSDDRERTWHVSATNECRLCHDAGAGTVLGFTPNQLELPQQLATLASQRVIAAVPEVPQSLRLVDPHDASQPLDDRARSYLHANCSMCHHRGGNAIVSIYLRRDLPFDQLNTNKGTIIGTFGMHDAKVIAAGDPYRSVMMYRMSTLGFGRMPYVGSYAVDSAGVALIADWIRSLPPVDTVKSPPLNSRSPEAAALVTLNDSTADAAKRTAALKKLIDSTEGSLALLAKMHGGKLNATDITLAVALGRQTPQSDLRGLFEHFVPENERRKRLGPNIKPESILSLAGDAERGKLIYFSDAGRCRACHELSDAKKSLGPTLVEINTKYAKPLEMLQHVLEPSLKVDEKFATFTVITNDGRLETGLLVEKDTQRVRLRNAENKLIDVPLADVDQLQKSTRSLMPEKILSDLTAQEAADLLEYIRQATSEQ